MAEQKHAEQEHVEQERTEQERAGQSRAEERAGLEREGTDATPVGDSSSSGGGGSEDRFRVQVASFADLNELTRENRETLEEVKRLLGQPTAADTLPSDAELTCQLGELDSLIGMAKTLDEMTVSASLANCCRYAATMGGEWGLSDYVKVSDRLCSLSKSHPHGGRPSLSLPQSS